MDEMAEKNGKPTKNQGEIQGSRKPMVLVGFLRQKKDCVVYTPSVVSKSYYCFALKCTKMLGFPTGPTCAVDCTVYICVPLCDKTKEIY